MRYYICSTHKSEEVIVGRMKEYYWEMIEYFDQHPEEDNMNPEFINLDIQEMMKEFEAMLDNAPVAKMEDNDLDEMADEWGRDSDLSMPLGPYGDEEAPKAQKTMNTHRKESPTIVGKVVETVFGKGVVQEINWDKQHGSSWKIKLDVSPNPADDIMRTCHPEDFDIIDEMIPPVINETVHHPIDTTIYYPGAPSLENDGHNNGGGNKCNCGIAATYRDHHAQMHDRGCPLHDKKNWK